MLDYAKKSYITKKENPFKYLQETRITDRDGLIITLILCAGLVLFTSWYSHKVDEGMKTHTVQQWDVKGNLQSSNIGQLIQGK